MNLPTDDQIRAALERIQEGLIELHSIVVIVRMETHLLEGRVDKLEERVAFLEGQAA